MESYAKHHYRKKNKEQCNAYITPSDTFDT